MQMIADNGGVLSIPVDRHELSEEQALELAQVTHPHLFEKEDDGFLQLA